MKAIARNFFNGVLVVVPVAATVYLLYWLFSTLDNLVRDGLERWLDLRIPGLGVLVMLVAITIIGFITSNFLARWIVALMDRIFTRLPLAKLIYSAIKDLMEAFVGEKKRFDKPVLVSLGEIGAEIMGFITREDLTWLDRRESVAVYFPQSYNFAGQVLVFPRTSITPIDAESGAVMQFIVSGGVSGGA